jgi:branched-chain amino acid aminotransferase
MSTLLFNGHFIPSNLACIKANDRGFTLGHGLFETILVNQGHIPALDYHWDRLAHSTPILNIPLPFSKSTFKDMLMEVIHENQLHTQLAGVRMTLTQGEAARGLLPSQTSQPSVVMATFAHHYTRADDYTALIVTIRKNELAPSSRIKSISYLDNILAKQAASEQGYQEAILLNTTAHVADGAASTVFIVQKNQIITPPIADGALPGVIRNLLINEFQSDFPIIEKTLSVSDLLDADEIFFTNALIGVQPVSRINTTNPRSRAVGIRLGDALRERKNYV